MDKPVVENTELLRSALAGLSRQPKMLDPKWFYDAAGSALFEDITGLPEYYPTRTELEILRAHVGDLAAAIPDGGLLVELGAGSSTKTRVLLDAVPALAGYVPIDISAAFLMESAARIAEAYPGLDVIPLASDFLEPPAFPATLETAPKVAFFPGSTIGNLDPDVASQLLRQVRKWPEISAFVLGVDLVKAPEILVRAYDDAAGVTAAFNLNVLHRLNRETGATFDVSRFRHEARWNAGAARIEMHLVSNGAQIVSIGGHEIEFTRGESIHTENSHKYSRESLAEIAARGGWAISRFVTDAENLFAVAVLVPLAA